jgi:hypothetical protein
MVIIGICGGIGHGKTTLAEAFGRIEPQSVHLESFEVIAEVIDAWLMRSPSLPSPHDLNAVNAWVQLLPDILAQVVHVTTRPEVLAFGPNDIAAHAEFYEKLLIFLESVQKNPALLNTRISATNKAQFRPLLQWLGGYLVMMVDPGIWYKELMRRTAAAEKQGIRLCTIGGVRYLTDAELVRRGGGFIVSVRRPLLGDLEMSDPTERERKKIRVDITVVNDAGLKELARCARQIYADIRLGKPQKRYAATDIHV